jgi:hypothetical protein
MVTAALPVHVESIRPSAVYRDTVYTQDAVVSLGHGPEFEIYDVRAILSADHVGTTRCVELLAFLGRIRRSPADERGIVFDREAQPVFRGVVTEIDRSGGRELGVLDVGCGTVLCKTSEAEFEVERGDWLQLSRTVRHLTGVQ